MCKNQKDGNWNEGEEKEEVEDKKEVRFPALIGLKIC